MNFKVLGILVMISSNVKTIIGVKTYLAKFMTCKNKNFKDLSSQSLEIYI